MMGRQVGEAQLFYIFSVDRHGLAEHYSYTGRPSIDPELMIRMLLVG